MNENIIFYKCEECGKFIDVIGENVKDVKCCDKSMTKLNANSVDAAIEKHIPVCKKVGDELIVSVGEIEHPMEVEHSIMWIAQVYGDEINRVYLKSGEKPEAKFKYIENATLYAYCNKHGLWRN